MGQTPSDAPDQSEAAVDALELAALAVCSEAPNLLARIRSAHELSVVHRLAFHLELALPKVIPHGKRLFVDTEVHRQGEQLKPASSQNQTGSMRPDLIVHERTEYGEGNILILEFKWHGVSTEPARNNLVASLGPPLSYACAVLMVGCSHCRTLSFSPVFLGHLARRPWSWSHCSERGASHDNRAHVCPRE